MWWLDGNVSGGRTVGAGRQWWRPATARRREPSLRCANSPAAATDLHGKGISREIRDASSSVLQINQGIALAQQPTGIEGGH